MATKLYSCLLEGFIFADICADFFFFFCSLKISLLWCFELVNDQIIMWKLHIVHGYSRVLAIILLHLIDSTTWTAFWGCKYTANNVISRYFTPVLSHILALLNKYQWNDISGDEKLLLFYVYFTMQTGCWQYFLYVGL